MTSINSGGCFCKSCMKQFTGYLKERNAAGLLGAEWDGVSPDTFHYGEYLKAHDCTCPQGAPFYRDYWEFQVRNAAGKKPEILTLEGEPAPEYEICKEGENARLVLRRAGLCTVVAFT